MSVFNIKYIIIIIIVIIDIVKCHIQVIYYSVLLLLLLLYQTTIKVYSVIKSMSNIGKLIIMLYSIHI